MSLEQTEILEPLHNTLRELLELESQGKSQDLEYTDDDIIAATLVYTHVTGNRLIHWLTEEKASIGIAKILSANMALQITTLTKQITNVDVSKYYKGKK